MSVFTGILFAVCVVFGIYKMCFKLYKRKQKLGQEKYGRKDINITFSSPSVDLRFYSKPTFDFPNIQSELDLKILNSGLNLCEEQSEILVKPYCKY